MVMMVMVLVGIAVLHQAYAGYICQLQLWNTYVYFSLTYQRSKGI